MSDFNCFEFAVLDHYLVFLELMKRRMKTSGHIKGKGRFFIVWFLKLVGFATRKTV